MALLASCRALWFNSCWVGPPPPHSAAGDGDHQNSTHGWDPFPNLLLGMEIISTAPIGGTPPQSAAGDTDLGAPMGGTPPPTCCWGCRSSAQHPQVGPPPPTCCWGCRSGSTHGWDPQQSTHRWDHPPNLLLGMQIISTAPMGGTPPPTCCWGCRSSTQPPWVGPPAEHP